MMYVYVSLYVHYMQPYHVSVSRSYAIWLMLPAFELISRY